MPIFLRKIAVSLVLLLVLVAALRVVYRAWSKATMERALTLDPSVTTVALGDSHAQCSLDDRGLRWVRNFGDSAESSVISYWKLHHLLARNPEQIRKVVFFVSPYSITSTIEQRWHGQPQFTDLRLTTENLGFLLPAKARATFQEDWHRKVYLGLKYDLGIPLDTFYASRLGLGGYYPYEGAMPNASVSPGTPDLSHPVAGPAVTRSPLLIDHIRRLVTDATDYGAAVYLVNSPVLAQVSDAGADERQCNVWYQSLMDELAADPRVRFLDLSDLPLAADCFRDAMHLNDRGARAFTDLLLREIGQDSLPDSRHTVNRLSRRIPGPRAYAIGAATLLVLCLLPFRRAGEAVHETAEGEPGGCPQAATTPRASPQPSPK